MPALPAARKEEVAEGNLTPCSVLPMPMHPNELQDSRDAESLLAPSSPEIAAPHALGGVWELYGTENRSPWLPAIDLSVLAASYVAHYAPRAASVMTALDERLAGRRRLSRHVEDRE